MLQGLSAYRLPPKIAELLVAEFGAFGAVFVLEVDDHASGGAAELWTAQASADHLFVEHLAHGGAGHDDVGDFRGIEACGEDFAVAEHFDAAGFDVARIAAAAEGMCTTGRSSADERRRT